MSNSKQLFAENYSKYEGVTLQFYNIVLFFHVIYPCYQNSYTTIPFLSDSVHRSKIMREAKLPKIMHIRPQVKIRNSGQVYTLYEYFFKCKLFQRFHQDWNYFSMNAKSDRKPNKFFQVSYINSVVTSWQSKYFAQYWGFRYSFMR